MTSITPSIREVKALKGRPAGFSLLFDPTGTADEIVGWYMDTFEHPEHLVHWQFMADRFAETQPTDIADNPPFAYINASVPDTSTMEIAEITGVKWKNKKLMESTIKQLKEDPCGLLAQGKNVMPALVEDHIVTMVTKPEVRKYLGLGKPAEPAKKPAPKKPVARSGKAKAKASTGKSVAPRAAAAKAKAKRVKKAAPAKKPAMAS